jgi:hypothetical protein
MKTSRLHLLCLLSLSLLSALLASGCEGLGSADRDDAPGKGKDKAAEAKKVLVGRNVFLEVLPGGKRRVLVSGSVCLREGQLEQLLCRKQTKEHEAILTADVDARHIHQALLLAGAREGKPVQFQPTYRPASGQTIKVTLTYEDRGRRHSVPAQSWIKNMKDGKALESNWVFAGSRLVDNPLDPDKKIYLANEGDLICVSNFEGALLDLPINSPKDNADHIFVAFTERIPPVDTKVVIILEPVPEPKKDKK